MIRPVVLIAAASLLAVGFVDFRRRRERIVDVTVEGQLANLKASQKFQLESPSYFEVDPTELETTYRRPKVYDGKNVDLFSHPKVTAAFLNQKESTRQIVYDTCFGPEGNIDIFWNQDLIKNDLLDHQAYTVFNLDCRDRDANPLIAFIVIIDQEGSIVNLQHAAARAESVNMYNSDTVLYSCIGNAGVYLWNWRTDQTYTLPFDLDAHTVQYVPTEDLFYGLVKAAKFDPSVAIAVDSRGQQRWAYTQEGSHINWMSINGNYVYLSLRSSSTLIKLDKRTNEVIWRLGGADSDLTYYTAGGRLGDFSTSWNHQHKFQALDDRYVSLFNNNVDKGKAFVEDRNSDMVILEVDEVAMTAREVFRYDTGDKSKIYGGADILPSGNVLGNSYPIVVEPENIDRQYMVNLWEVTSSGELAWRVGIKGKNPFSPADTSTPFYHSVAPEEEPPVGWMVYNVERLYDAPVLSEPCRHTSNDGKSHFVQVMPFNSIRTQGNTPGMAYLLNAQDEVMSTKTITFHRNWLPIKVQMPFVALHTNLDIPLKMVVSNMWEDVRVVEIGSFQDLPICSNVPQTGRLFT